MHAPKRQLIRRQVERLLQQNRVNQAPVDVEAIALSLNAQVRKQPTDEEVSGFLYREPGKPAVIGVNSRQHPNRQRFTIAHEIGHLALHNFESVHVDRGFFVKLRGPASSTGENVEEVEANLFAAELLMPRAFLKADLAQHNTVDFLDDEFLQGLAARYGVSVQAMTIRLSYLGYLPSDKV